MHQQTLLTEKENIMAKQSTLVRVERSQQSISVQVARSFISAGVAASSRNVEESLDYFTKAIDELKGIMAHLSTNPSKG